MDLFEVFPQVGQHVDVHGEWSYSHLSFTPIPTPGQAIIRQLMSDKGFEVLMSGINGGLDQV
jgi:ubiquinone/menaquinone biosynthesis C-methylase UbiE